MDRKTEGQIEEQRKEKTTEKRSLCVSFLMTENKIRYQETFDKIYYKEIFLGHIFSHMMLYVDSMGICIPFECKQLHFLFILSIL